MRAMVLARPGQPLQIKDLPVPQPAPGEVLVQVSACGVCRTDLHIVDGELADPKLPLVLGHQIVGTVVETDAPEHRLQQGDTVGIPWLGKTCGCCRFCRSGLENLCDKAVFTGYKRDGGFAEYTVVDGQFCFPIPTGFSDLQTAPLLCAGLIGYRSYIIALETAAGAVNHLGLYGFGSAAHILIQVAVHQGREVYAFTRPGDQKGQDFARRLGAVWAGDSGQLPPQELDAAIIFAPVGSLVPLSLLAVRKGGAVICAGIHMSDIPSFPYANLWGERVIKSVANLTRQNGVEFLKLAAVVPVKTEITVFSLEMANEALEAIRSGTLTGSAVLRI